MKMVKITSQIKFIISVLSLITITIGGVTVYLNDKTSKDSNVINVAGKQRMLTQKMAKEIFLCDKLALQSSVDLESSMREFDSSLKDLIAGNKPKGIYAPPTENILNNITSIEKSWQDFRVDIKEYQTKKEFSKNTKDKLILQNQDLLEKSDEIVKQIIALSMSSYYIERSGKQRMLTQKMAFHISSFVLNRSSFDFKNFYEALDGYEKTIMSFLDDEKLKSHQDLYGNLKQISELFATFKSDSYKFIDNEMAIDKLLDKIAIKNVMILNSIDDVVSEYSNYSKEQREFLQNFQYIAITIAIIFIIYSFALVLNIQKLFEKFVSHSKDISSITTPHNKPVMFAEDEMTDELSVAVKHINTFAENINDILAQANTALEESKKAIEKLANMAQDEPEIEGIEKEKLKKALDTSEDIAIQSLEDLSNTANMLKKLQQNFNNLHK